MAAGDLTILAALAAGVLSFLSPCVLPLVPAYLGQLTAVAVAAETPSSRDVAGGPAAGAPRISRFVALRNAIAYVLGFGAIFTVLGVTATFAAGPLVDWLPGLRVVGGLVLVVLGLNLAGVLTIARLERVWRPLEPGAQGALATRTGGFALGGGSSAVDRLGGRLVGSRSGPIASFGLGAIFAVGWTPCIGTILGGILTLAATSGTTAQGAILLVAYTTGLGLPFIALALVYDRAPGILRPLVRHGRAVSAVGGLLVVAIGLAMAFDLLALLPRYFTFLTGI